MKKLDEKSFMEIRTWVHRNARPLELAEWNYRYEGGKKEDVISELSYYQNEDGGFGHALEPDLWNPMSSPYATLKAVEILRKSQLIDSMEMDHPLIQGIFRFLDSGLHRNEDGWQFCIPSNDDAPHAPWWTYSEETNRIQSMGVTAGLCAFVLRYGSDWSDLYQKAMGYAGRILGIVEGADDFGEMGIGGVMIMMGDMIQCGLAKKEDCDPLMEKLAKAANKAIERNPEMWQYYTPRPSNFIWSPSSLLYRGNEEIIELQLDYEIDARIEGGVWNINWSWFDLMETYAREFALSENWWKSSVAMDRLEFLQAFGRVDAWLI